MPGKLGEHAAVAREELGVAVPGTMPQVAPRRASPPPNRLGSWAGARPSPAMERSGRVEEHAAAGHVEEVEAVDLHHHITAMERIRVGLQIALYMYI